MEEERKNDGGQAFPLQNAQFIEAYGGSPGMTLRDYFAGQVLAGFMSSKPMHFNPGEDAAYCYKVADAMIEERSR